MFYTVAYSWKAITHCEMEKSKKKHLFTVYVYVYVALNREWIFSKSSGSKPIALQTVMSIMTT